MQKTQVRSLGQEDPLEKEMATHFSILAWKLPWTKEPGWLQIMGMQRVGHDGATERSTAAPTTLTENLPLEIKSHITTTHWEYWVFGFLLFV